MLMPSACPGGKSPGPTRGIVKWVEQSWGFPPGVGEFNKTKSPGSSASQWKIPLISTSYNWDSLDGGVFLWYLGMKFYSFVSGSEKQYNIFIEQKSLQWKTTWSQIHWGYRETDSSSVDYLRWPEIIYLMILKNCSYSLYFIYVWIF